MSLRRSVRIQELLNRENNEVIAIKPEISRKRKRISSHIEESNKIWDNFNKIDDISKYGDMWVSPSSIKNYMLKDPVLDYFKLMNNSETLHKPRKLFFPHHQL